MEAKDASDDDGDGFWPTRPKAAKDDGRPSDLRLSPAEGDPASLDDILLSEGKDDDDEPSSPSRPSEVKDAKEIGNRQRTLSRTLSGAYRATRARVTRTSSDDGDKARKKVEALVGVLANAQATSTKLLKAASQLRVLAMDKEAKTAVVDAGAVPQHLLSKGGSSDPVVTFEAGGTTVSSTVKKKDLDPIWREDFSLEVERDQTVSVLVEDQDVASGNDFMGRFDVDVAAIFDLRGEPRRAWHGLLARRRRRRRARPSASRRAGAKISPSRPTTPRARRSS